MAETRSALVEDLTALWQLTNLTADDFDALRAEVSQAEATPRLHVLCDAVSEEHRPSIHALGRLATAIRLDEPELRDLLVEHLDQIVDVPPSSIATEDLTRAVDRSIHLLQTKPIRLYVSSVKMRTAHEHTFLSARIVTDLRPILSDNPETSSQEVVAMLRRHNLALTTVDEENERRKHYFILDDEDLTYLAVVLYRAIQESSTLEQFTGQSNLTDLSLIGPRGSDNIDLDSES